MPFIITNVLLSPTPALLVPRSKQPYTIGCKNVHFEKWTLVSKYHNNPSNSFINYSKCCLLIMVAYSVLLALLTESNTTSLNEESTVLSFFLSLLSSITMRILIHSYSTNIQDLLSALRRVWKGRQSLL